MAWPLEGEDAAFAVDVGLEGAVHTGGDEHRAGELVSDREGLDIGYNRRVGHDGGICHGQAPGVGHGHVGCNDVRRADIREELACDLRGGVGKGARSRPDQCAGDRAVVIIDPGGRFPHIGAAVDEDGEVVQRLVQLDVLIHRHRICDQGVGAQGLAFDLQKGRGAITNGKTQNPGGVHAGDRSLVFAVEVAGVVSGIGPRTGTEPVACKAKMAAKTESYSREE